MNDNDRIVKVFTDSEVAVVLLKEVLEQNGISALIRNDFNSGIFAGFAGGVPSAIDLFVQQADVNRAKAIIEDFNKSNTNQAVD
jgi:hypothetical protein